MEDRRTALIQTTLDGAARKGFSVLTVEIKSDWKRFTQVFSKKFNSERNNNIKEFYAMKFVNYQMKQKKQLAVRIETLVRKSYSLDTHDYKNTTMTEILMMTLTAQLQKLAIKKRASHPSSIREPDLDFRKLVNKLEQAEITMKLEVTENLKLQYVNNIQITTLLLYYFKQINLIIDSDTDSSEKITKILNIYKKNPNFKSKPSFKKGVIIVDDTDRVLLNADKNNKITKINHKKIENPSNHFINTWRKINFYSTKTFIVIRVQENHFQITPISLDNNHPIIRIIEKDHLSKEIHEISHSADIVDHIVEIVSIKITIQDQIQTNPNFLLKPDPIKILEIEIIQIIDLETLHTTDIEDIPTIVRETIQTFETLDIKKINHAINLTTDQNTINTKIGHAITHRTKVQAITTD